MRHGETVSGMPDWQRVLSDKGRAQSSAMAQSARRHGVSVAWVYHSGILRAQQTAELVAAVLAPEKGVREISGLCPDDDPWILKAQLDVTTQSVLLVSHLPYLSRLAGLMVTGRFRAFGDRVCAGDAGLPDPACQWVEVRLVVICGVAVTRLTGAWRWSNK